MCRHHAGHVEDLLGNLARRHFDRERVFPLSAPRTSIRPSALSTLTYSSFFLEKLKITGTTDDERAFSLFVLSYFD